MSNKKKENEESTLPTAVKGTIAVMLTVMVVVIITMLFAKSLFISSADSEPKKTGSITSTEYVFVTTQATVEVTETTSATTTKSTEDPYQSDNTDSLGEYTVMTVNSAVYLHPEPSSKSDNLLVIPTGASCKVYSNESGWLYLDYNGQLGYAYYTFFTGTLPTATSH